MSLLKMAAIILGFSACLWTAGALLFGVVSLAIKDLPGFWRSIMEAILGMGAVLVAYGLYGGIG